jgi:hypothetical protein
VDNPQALTDEDMNILFNAADVGLNTAMGEGWGLCNFEAAVVGVPQIVPALGGFLDFFDDKSAILIQPKIKLYTDMTIDGCPGCAEICDAADFAEAIDRYYADDELRKIHSQNARKQILQRYRWNDLGEKLYQYVLKVSGVEVEKKSEEAINVDRIGLSEIEKLTQNLKPSFDLDKKKLKKKQVIVEDSTSEEEEEEEESEDLSLKKLKLLKLKSKIDKLLGEL